ncbi:MAG: hypothetical protein ABI723_22140 [Bacteroidia bacterium]
MIKKISKTEAIREKLKSENKVSYLDAQKHRDAVGRMDDELKEVRREYKEKEMNSQTSASTVVLTD